MIEFKAGLYIVSTPIGNMNDITLRALSCLKRSDIILCEDTRVTQKLLQKHEIYDKKLWTYNDHSSEIVREKIVSIINEGLVVALVSDAGTPLIADPGYKLIRYLQEQNIYYDIIPGVSATISALVLSGLPTDKFFFGGFMPRTEYSREKILKEVENLDSTLVFYDTSHRIYDSIKSVYNILGNREVVVAREITKIFQEVLRAKAEDFLENKTDIKLKGEFVLLISKDSDFKELNETEIKELIKKLKISGLTKRDIADQILANPKNKCKKIQYTRYVRVFLIDRMNF